MKKATEDQFNELHSLVTEEFLQRVRSGTASTQDLKAACDWLKTNDISGVAYEGSPLDKLATALPKVDPDLIQRRLYGRKHV
jgi:hypothetical protein